MQRRLKAKVIVSAQSLAILEKLAYDVMKKEANRMFGEGSGELDNGYSYPEPLSRQQEDHTPTLQEPLPAAPTSNGSGAKNDMLDLSSIEDMQSNENRLLFDGLLPDTLLGLGSSMAEVDKLFWDLYAPPPSGADMNWPGLYMTDETQVPGPCLHTTFSQIN